MSLRSSWLGVALIAGGLPFLTQDYAGVHRGEEIGALLLLGGLLLLARSGWHRGGGALALLLPLAALAGALVVDESLRPFEAGRHPELPVFAGFAHGLAQFLGEPSARVGGELLLQDQQGALRAAASWGAVGWRPLFAFALLSGFVAFSLHGKGSTRAWLLACAAALFLAMLRFAVIALHYSGVEEVLTMEAHPAVWNFYDPWSLLVVLLVAAIGAGGITPTASPAPAAPSSAPAPFRVLLLAAIAGLSFGAAAGWSDPGTPKRGRVLVDERLTGAWEPAGRMLDTERYGDFSAYSLSAMVEQLSHRFSVEVNAEHRYDAATLAEVDVLVLKTPEHALDDAEIAAIRSWTEAGGGLFLISDHTDLLGMSTHLRPLAEPYGIEFGFDAVNDAGGGFNHWSARLLPEHPISTGLGELEFMTGCSLRCHGAARPVLTLRHAASMAGDYSQSSHFGTRAANPADPQGLLVAAAAAPAGRGRVLAFSDSTVLSSFAWPLFARADFVYRGIAWLDRSASPARHLRWAWLLCGAGALVFAARAARGLTAHAAPALVLGLAAGGIAGFWISMQLLASALRFPDPPPSVPRIGFVIEGGHAALPAVLGDQSAGLPEQSNFATFFQVPLRLGMEVQTVTRDPRALAQLDALVVVNPDVELGQPEAPEGWVEAVHAWVADGGRLLVLSRAGHLGHDHDRAPLYFAGLSLEHAETAAPEVDVDLGRHGSGRVVRVIGAEAFAEEGMGHCMQFPGRDERRRYEAAYQIYHQLLELSTPERRTWRPR